MEEKLNFIINKINILKLLNMKFKTILYLILFVIGNSCSQSNEKLTDYYPFKISKDNGKFTILAQIESPDLYPKYVNFFEKHGSTGNGDSWAGLITHILNKNNPELLKHIEFDPEAGGFFAYVDTESNQIKIIELISPIFADFKKLEIYIKEADKSLFDD